MEPSIESIGASHKKGWVLGGSRSGRYRRRAQNAELAAVLRSHLHTVCLYTWFFVAL